jgi:PadR family transcriptional regulator PadR
MQDMSGQSAANIKAQMRKGTLELSILALIAREEIYASDIIKELQKYDLLVVEGTLYPLLSRLKRLGLVAYTWRESSQGPPRKYYSLTGAGRSLLKELTIEWNELASSIKKLLKYHA